MKLHDLINQNGKSVYFNENGDIWKGIADGSVSKEKTVYSNGYTLHTPHNGRNRHGLVEIWLDNEISTVAVLDLYGFKDSAQSVMATYLLWTAQGKTDVTPQQVAETVRTNARKKLGVPTL